METQITLSNINEIKPIDLFSGDVFDILVNEVKSQAESTLLDSDVNTAKGRKDIISAATKVRDSRVLLEKAAKAAKEEHQIVIKKINEEVKKTSVLKDLQEEIRKPVTEWEQAEKDRIETIKFKINEFKRLAVASYESASSIRDAIKTLEAAEITEASFQEYSDEAKNIRDVSVLKLETQLAEKERDEALKAEQERARKEAERLKAEQEERERKAREAEKKRITEEREKLEAERRAFQKEQDKLKKIQAEKDAEIEKLKKEKEESARKEAEAKEAVEREKREKTEAEERRIAEAKRLEAEDMKRMANRLNLIKEIQDNIALYLGEPSNNVYSIIATGIVDGKIKGVKAI